MIYIDHRSFNEIDMTATAVESDGTKIQVLGHYEPTLAWYNETSGRWIGNDSWQWKNY